MWAAEKGTIFVKRSEEDRAHEEEVTKISAIFRYNKYKGFVDIRKSETVQFDHQHHCTRLWKHQLFSIFRTMLLNSCILWRNRAPTQSDRAPYDFLVAIVRSARTPTHYLHAPPSKKSLCDHRLAKGGGFLTCRSCKKRSQWVCSECRDPDSTHIPLCGTLARHCFILFHVPHV
jgi:hypothetical protein